MPKTISPMPSLAGVRQYVILGAGLDTFAYRNPFPQLRVFEVDFPAYAGVEALDARRSRHRRRHANLTFVALDFEHQTLAEGLPKPDSMPAKPAFFSWLGVVPYLTLDAFRATLAFIGSLPAGSGIAFDYAFPPDTLTPQRRAVFDLLAAPSGRRRRAVPALLHSGPDRMRSCATPGSIASEQADHEKLNQLYFRDRADGLKLSPAGHRHAGRGVGVRR